MSLWNSIKNEIITSNNILLILLSVVIFIFFEILFYWFIISNQLVYILQDKALLLADAANDDPSVKNDIIGYLNSANPAQNDISSEITNIKNQRMAQNYQLMTVYLFPMFITIASLLVLVSLYKIGHYFIYGKHHLSWTYFYVIFLTMFVFLVEIIFYYLVINPWKIISDAKFLSAFQMAS